MLKDLLELYRVKFTNTQLRYQKNVYIDNIDDIVNEYNNTYHRTIKMKPFDVKSGNYTEFSVNAMLLMILIVNKLLEQFMKKNSKKQLKKHLE